MSALASALADYLGVRRRQGCRAGSHRTAGRRNSPTPSQPGEVTSPVRSKDLGIGSEELKAVADLVDGKSLDQALLEVGGDLDVVAESEVDPHCHAGVVTEADLQCHAALEHPPPGLGAFEAGDDALEQYPAPEPIAAGTGVCRPAAGR